MSLSTIGSYCATGFILLLAQSSAGADLAHLSTNEKSNINASEAIAFSGLKRGDNVADFLPVDGSFTQAFCEALGDSGRVYVITLSPSVTRYDIATCANVSTHILKSRNFPAPELYNSSDDPGAVYEYYTSRLPLESFVAPEPLDMIWLSRVYHKLSSKEYGSPNMKYVTTALWSALKPNGVLIIDDHAGAEQAKQQMIAVGFEFVGASGATADKQEQFLLKFRKP